MRASAPLAMVGAAFAFAFFGDAMTDVAVWVHCFESQACSSETLPDRDVRYAGFGIGSMATILFASWAAHFAIRTRKEAIGLVTALIAGGLWTVLQIGVGPGLYPDLLGLHTQLGLYAATATVFLIPLLILKEDATKTLAGLAASILVSLTLSVVVFEWALGGFEHADLIYQPYALVAASTAWAMLAASPWLTRQKHPHPRRWAFSVLGTAAAIAALYGSIDDFDAGIGRKSAFLGAVTALLGFIPQVMACAAALAASTWLKRVAIALGSTVCVVAAASALIFLAPDSLHVTRPELNTSRLPLVHGLATALAVASGWLTHGLVSWMFWPK